MLQGRARVKRQSRPTDAAELLALVPGRNLAIRVESLDEGLIVWVKLQKHWWMGPPLGWFLPFRSEKGFALDVLGRQVFEACDGQHSLESIIEEFARRHRLRFHEAKHSVVTFTRWLMERRIIYLARDGHSA
jgi:hypothetical protein